MPGLSQAGAAVPDFEPIHAHAPGAAPAADEPRDSATTLRWGFALGMLVVLAVCMVAALNALSTL